MKQVVLVGFGRWGRNVLRDLIQIGVNVHVVDIEEEARDLALAMGASTVSVALADIPPSAGALVAVPIELTGSVVLQLLQELDRVCPNQSIPVFVEKPLSHSVPMATRLVSHGAQRIFVMDKWRYHPAVEAARSMIESGELGPLTSITLQRWDSWASPRSLSTTWWLAPHDLSMVLHWLGWLPEVVLARRTVNSVAEDLWVTLRGGKDSEASRRSAAAELTAHTPELTVTIDIRTASAVRRRAFELIGERRTVRMRDPDDPYLEVAQSDNKSAVAERCVPVPNAQPLRLELEHFVAYLCGGSPPLSSAAEGLRVVEHLARIDELTGATQTPLATLKGSP